MFKHNQYLLSDIIKYVKDTQFADDDFCLYGKYGASLNLTDLYLVSDYPEVINDKDVYPQDVTEESFGLVYYGEHFIDVISSALEQKESASENELLEALIFFYKHDNFISFK
ncbi:MULTISPECIES: hypothetical protein [unclassified Neisseria]|uniref:DUF7716 domain-containing protein n=1 Tax=unclassified Neisseria TaxID=2623750 RepID=UPI001072AEC5|nr:MULTISPECIES: hypothetical protein [unclassified Neisseria]MBF0804459.1 hypothetical protein [Neisseria sp. 19428wB4_WF04]TFU40525.1 hypothetical protein E4T99_08905 [Neisseria sp. WF04]